MFDLPKVQLHAIHLTTKGYLLTLKQGFPFKIQQKCSAQIEAFCSESNTRVTPPFSLTQELTKPALIDHRLTAKPSQTLWLSTQTALEVTNVGPRQFRYSVQSQIHVLHRPLSC